MVKENEKNKYGLSEQMRAVHRHLKCPVHTNEVVSTVFGKLSKIRLLNTEMKYKMPAKVLQSLAQ